MIVCADDYGLSPDIGWAIADLADKGRVTAVSSIVAAPGLEARDFAALRERRGQLDLGLHWSLLNFPPLSAASEVPSLTAGAGRCHSFRSLLRRSLSGAVRPDEAKLELARQYERFERCFGGPPDFIDSHLHVHQFPGVREGLLGFLAGLPEANRPYVRNSWTPLGKILRQRVAVAKACWISPLGGLLRRRLLAAGVSTNAGFAGIYDYERYRKFGTYLARFIACIEPGNAILMVHPGLQEPWRKAEYEALAQAPIPVGLLGRFRRASASPG